MEFQISFSFSDYILNCNFFLKSFLDVLLLANGGEALRMLQQGHAVVQVSLCNCQVDGAKPFGLVDLADWHLGTLAPGTWHLGNTLALAACLVLPPRLLGLLLKRFEAVMALLRQVRIRLPSLLRQLRPVFRARHV